MSLGYEGVCKLVDQDDELVIYAYSGANYNENYEEQKLHRLDYDGVIMIHKRCLEEPEIQRKMKRRPSGRKFESVKRIVLFPNISDHIKNGDIVIEKECHNAFRRYSTMSVDYIAHLLLIKIFEFYQENGRLPEKEGFIQ